jgi:hypothetical protein
LQLSWRELDDHTVEVATKVAGERLAVSLQFNTEG